MANITPAALRLVEPEWAAQVPSPAHDALTPADRREYLANNPASYLGVTKGPEDLAPGQTMSNEELLQSGRQALDELLIQRAFSSIHSERFYLYQLQTDEHIQTAIVGNVSTQDFSNGNVRLHELVQLDRASHLGNHLRVVAAQSSPIALAHRGCDELDQLIAGVIAGAEPQLDFSAGDGVTQRVWEITGPEHTSQIIRSYQSLTLYLIDGHHRAAAARSHHLSVGNKDSETTFCAVFSARQLRNRAHHRILSLGEDTEDFLARLQQDLPVRVVSDNAVAEARNTDEIALWHGQSCYLVTVPFSATSADADGLSAAERLEDLDPVRLQRGIIGPLLGVDGSWSGEQLTYRPGVKPVSELRQSTIAANEILCVMRPVEVDDLLDASDDGLVMPPKSTYFEPKARSGVFIRHLALD